MAKAIMIQGTMSNAGKSLIAAGLCRIFAQDGYRVAPFKSQNMALNSYVTVDGLEMGRAQVVQAMAAGKEPDVRMNPILLKPTTDVGSQVILMGKVQGNQRAFDYYKNKVAYIPTIREAYESLSAENDIIVIEGAGSPVEINLKENDIVNMGMADIADADVLLVGDIDRGGVFAQLIGTMELLEPDERDRVKGLIINKFRGDVSLLEPGLEMLEGRCGKRVVGVVPYTDVDIEDEDSLAKSLISYDIRPDCLLDIAVIKLGKLSNFTDVTPFVLDKDVSVRYVENSKMLGEPDLIIIPGSKNTISDMKQMEESGLGDLICKLAGEGTSAVMGICGGYQIMGQTISDMDAVESELVSTRGLGLLPIATTIGQIKKTTQSEGLITVPEDSIWADLAGIQVSGYEIHMGDSYVNQKDITSFIKYNDGSADGCALGNCIGTYFHGIFENDEFREGLLNILAARKNIKRVESALKYRQYREEQFDILADALRASLDMDYIYGLLSGDNEEKKIELPYKDLAPGDIEKKSFETIDRELICRGIHVSSDRLPVVRRAIHTTADFEYAHNLVFSDGAVLQMCEAIKNGALIVTDTNMAKSGINMSRLSKYGGEVVCFMADEEVAGIARTTGQTRATVSMEKAAGLNRDIIFAIGNAPTALIKLDELMKSGFVPKGIIGVPVGFVNVVEAKELIIQNTTVCPYIVARGRKGGSNLAAAIVNALVLECEKLGFSNIG